jgi:nucleoside 2-deoxyribosyltransferase
LISKTIADEGYNILSSRLSRTPPSLLSSDKISVFVAACEPIQGRGTDISSEKLKAALEDIPSEYSVNDVDVIQGTPAQKTLYLVPRRVEVVTIDSDLFDGKNRVIQVARDEYFRKYQKYPMKFIFVSRKSPSAFKRNVKNQNEQKNSLVEICSAIEQSGCAMLVAPDPADANKIAQDEQVFKAVFHRLWAADACLVLALDTDGSGTLSQSMAHEFGFFAGRGKPHTIFVSDDRAKNRTHNFGNIAGKNWVEYKTFTPRSRKNSESIYAKVTEWLESISLSNNG